MQKLTQLYQKFVTPQFIRFFVIGVTVFFVDFGILSFFVYLLNFRPIVLGFSVPNVISTIIGLTMTFLLNRWWTFGIKSKDKVTKHGAKFVMTSAVVWFFHNLAFGFLVQLGAAYWLAKIMVMAVQMVVNFVVYKFVVFT